jgi:hypothetical protein
MAQEKKCTYLEHMVRALVLNQNKEMSLSEIHYALLENKIKPSHRWLFRSLMRGIDAGVLIFSDPQPKANNLTFKNFDEEIKNISVSPEVWKKLNKVGKKEEETKEISINISGIKV